MKSMQWDVKSKFFHLLVTTNHIKKISDIEFLSEIPKTKEGTILSRFDFLKFKEKDLYELQKFIVEYYSICRISIHREYDD